MAKKKLFNGSNYVGFATDDVTYEALWMNSVYRNCSIADLCRAIMGQWAKSQYAAIPEDKISATKEMVLAQRKK